MVANALNCGSVSCLDEETGLEVTVPFGPAGCCRGKDNTQAQAYIEAKEVLERMLIERGL